MLIRKDVHDVDAIVSIPGKGKQREGSEGEGAKGDDAENAENKEVTVDEACWIYEQLRRLAQDLSHPLITMLQQECTRQTCPEMKAGEWLYLCVAHGAEGAMEVRNSSSQQSQANLNFTAMLRHRLHPAHSRQRDLAPQLPAQLPVPPLHPRTLAPALLVSRSPTRTHLRARVLPSPCSLRAGRGRERTLRALPRAHFAFRPRPSRVPRHPARYCGL